MLFMTSRDTGSVARATFAHQEMFGRFVNPRRQSIDLRGWSAWVGDNGAFTGFDKDRFMNCIRKLLPYSNACKALIVPDVPFHWEPTLVKFRDWAPSIRRLGFPAAIAVQDGATIDNIPWGNFDALFVGGSTDWKRQSGIDDLPLFRPLGNGSPVAEIVQEAKRRGLWVHMGRSANSIRQLWYAFSLGVDSVDGTCETKAPDREFRWIAQTMWEIHQRSCTNNYYERG